MKTPGKTSENPSHIYYEMTLWDWKYWNSLTVGQSTSTISKPLKQKFHRFSSPPLLFKDSSSIKAQTLAGPTDHVRGIRGLLIWKKWVESVSSIPNLWTGYFRRSLQNKRQLHIHFSLERTYCTNHKSYMTFIWRRTEGSIFTHCKLTWKGNKAMPVFTSWRYDQMSAVHWRQNYKAYSLQMLLGIC